MNSNTKTCSTNPPEALSNREFAHLLLTETRRQIELQESLLEVHQEDFLSRERVTDPLDQASFEEIRNRALRLSEAEKNRFEKLRTAERRLQIALERDYYWDVFVCSQCGKNIDRNRLMAQPTTVHCHSCKEQDENRQRLYGHAPGQHLWHK